MLIDTHAHVNFKAFLEDADAVIKRALNDQVWIVNVGTQIDTSKSAVVMAEKYEQGVYAVVGLHPVHTYSQRVDEEESSFQTREEHFNTLEYESLAKSTKVVGIGECGLDYYRLPENNDRSSVIEKQKKAFIAQIKLAKELNKALVIHCRPSAGTQDAYIDILKILDKENNQKFVPEPVEGQISSQAILTRSTSSGIKIASSPLRFEIHSFTGSPEIVQEFLKCGACVGLNGIITFDKSGNMEKVVKAVPIEKIVLETDCPYLTPVPHRGKRNEPSYVKFVAEKVAQIKNILPDEIAGATTNNAKKLFNFL